MHDTIGRATHLPSLVKQVPKLFQVSQRVAVVITPQKYQRLKELLNVERGRNIEVNL